MSEAFKVTQLGARFIAYSEECPRFCAVRFTREDARRAGFDALAAYRAGDEELSAYRDLGHD